MAFQPIDDDQTTAGESLPSWTPLTLRADIDDCAVDRHVGCGWGYSSESNVRPTVSTLSTQWRNLWPFHLPVYRGGETVTVRVRYDAAIGAAAAGTNAVRIRLVVGGRAGSASTLTVTSATSSVDVSATVPSTGGGLIPCAVQIQSVRSASSVAGVRIWEVASQRFALCDVLTGSLSTGATHYEMVITGVGAGSTASIAPGYHVPQVSGTGGAGGSPAAYTYGLDIWPHVTGAATVGDGQNKLTGSGDVYDVGTITPHSYSVRVSGSMPSLSGSVGLSQVSTLRPARARSMQRLARAGRSLYDDRVRVWAMGPRGDAGTSSGGAYWCGYRATDGDVVRAALCDVRADAVGFVVAMLWRPIPAASTDDDITITIRIIADDGSELDSTAYTVPGEIIPEAGPVLPATQPGPSPVSSLARYNIEGSTGASWGARDLGEAGEELPLLGGYRRFIAPHEWPSASSAGDDVIVQVEISGSDSHVWDCLIAERYR